MDGAHTHGNGGGGWMSEVYATACDMYRDHMAGCLIANGMEPEQAAREALKTYPLPAGGSS